MMFSKIMYTNNIIIRTGVKILEQLFNYFIKYSLFMSIGIELRDEYMCNHLFSFEASIISYHIIIKDASKEKRFFKEKNLK